MEQDAAQSVADIDRLGNGYATLAGLVGTPLVLWSVGLVAAMLISQHCAAGGTWAWSRQRIGASVLCIAAGLVAGALTAHAAIQRFHLDLVVATYAARKAEACQKLEQAIANGRVVSLSRGVIRDILRPDCNYRRLEIASEEPGSRLRFVKRKELGPRGAPLDDKIGVPR